MTTLGQFGALVGHSELMSPVSPLAVQTQVAYFEEQEPDVLTRPYTCKSLTRSNWNDL